jgi:hypothetical protein
MVANCILGAACPPDPIRCYNVRMGARWVTAVGVAALLSACSSGPEGTGDGGGPDSRPPDPYRLSAEAAARGLDSAWMMARVAALAADAMNGRDNLSPGGKQAREYLLVQVKALGLQQVPGLGGWTQTFDKGVNVLAWLPGRDPALSDQVVVLGAHYDHLGRADVSGSQCKAGKGADLICNGAVDNASGCAVVLGLARALASSQTGLRRSLLVALWDAEEDGLLGSRHFVDHSPPLPLARIAANITVDAVGAQLIPRMNDTFALGIEYAGGLRELVKANNTPAGITTWPVSAFFVGSDTGGRSDHLPFRQKQIPAVFFSSGPPMNAYHTPDDELDLVLPRKLLATARHVLLTTADVANAPARLPFVARPGPHLDDARAMVAIGELVLADPAAVGVTDQVTIEMLKKLMGQLRAYLQTPPATRAEWDQYQSFIKGIITLVFSML